LKIWWGGAAPLQPVISDAALCAEALFSAARAGRLDLKRWSAEVKRATGTKGKALFQRCGLR
jgi:hypothetical protein